MAELDDAINEANAKFKELDKSIESLSSQLLKLQAAVAKPVADNSIAALSNKAKSLQTGLGKLNIIGDKLESELSLAQSKVIEYENAITKLTEAMKTGTSYTKQLSETLLVKEQTNLANALKEQNKFSAPLQSVLQKQIEETEKYNDAMDALRTKMQEQEEAAIQSNRFGSTAKKATDTLNLFTNNTPLGKFMVLGEVIAKAADALKELTDTIYKTQQNLGTNFATAQTAYINALYNSAKSFVSGNGPLLDTTEILDATKAFKTEFGTILDPAEATRIAGEAKQLGVSSDDYVKAKRAFLGTGGNEAGIRQRAVDQFRKAGLAGADAIKFAADNANLLAVAGDKYADSLFAAAADAKKIGINLGDIEKFANNIVGDFEGSLEKFSELAAMGIDLDFNQIAAVSATGTDEEILATLRQQLQQTGISGEELQTNRQLRLALTQATGMDEAALLRMSGQAGKPKDATVPEEQLNTQKSMLEKLTAILTVVSYGLGTIAAVLVANKYLPGMSTMTNSTLGKLGVGGAGLGIGIGGALAGRELVKSGQTGAGIGLGLAGGAAGGLLLAAALAPFTGGGSLALYAGLAAAGGLAAGGYAGMGAKKGDDIFSSAGYGARSLVTPTGTVALNNNDTVMAGTKLMSPGALTSPASTTTAPAVNTVNVDMSKLEARFDKLASSLGNLGNMKIEMDGHTVGRVSLNASSPLGRLAVVG